MIKKFFYNLFKNQNLKLLKIVIIPYFIILISLVVITFIFDISLKSNGDWFSFPTPWSLFLIFMYYAVPFIVGLVIGIIYRPFWRNFITVVVMIFLIHLLYSVVVLGIKSLYIKSRVFGDATNIVSISHKVVNGNHGEINDQIILSGELKTSTLSVADYVITPILYQDLEKQHGVSQRFLFNGVGVYLFSVSEQDKQKHFEMIFFGSDNSNMPDNFNNIKKNGDVFVDFKLRKKIEFDSIGRIVVGLCDWTAFFCRNSWEYYDPLLYEVPIQKMSEVYTFSLK